MPFRTHLLKLNCGTNWTQLILIHWQLDTLDLDLFPYILAFGSFPGYMVMRATWKLVGDTWGLVGVTRRLVWSMFLDITNFLLSYTFHPSNVTDWKINLHHPQNQTSIHICLIKISVLFLICPFQTVSVTDPNYLLNFCTTPRFSPWCNLLECKSENRLKVPGQRSS